MTSLRPWKLLKRNAFLDGGKCGLKTTQLSFMAVLCTAMLFILYRTAVQQHQHAEMEDKLLPFDVLKESALASGLLANLPRGIIHSSSDLELKPLWSSSSLRSKIVSYSHHNLLAISVGMKQKHNVDSIVQKFLAENFTVMLFHYDGNVDGWWDLEWSNQAIHIVAQNQTKWWFAKRFLHPAIVSIYDYIFLWDEDLGRGSTTHGTKYSAYLITVAMGDIDPRFIQDPEYRPELKPIEPDEIPVISLSVSSPSDIERVLSEIGDACQNWGFFQVINHGVPLELCQKIEKLAKEFFYQPLEEKLKVKRNEVYPMGYYDGEHTKNVRDWKEVFDFLLKDPTLVPVSVDPDDKELRTLTNQWPDQYPPEFREVCQEYAREVANLAYKLLELVSRGLGLPADRLIGHFKDQLSFCRLNYYPPCPAPHLALGVGRHKDATALTILAQDDIGGLEVKRKSDGEWIPVRPVPGAYIINVGDVLQVWTNDKYQSAEHRVVVNSKKERFSIPLFLFPSHYVDVKPLEELVNEQNPARYKEINWGRFYATRNRSDYKKQKVENIQIDHFRIL